MGSRLSGTPRSFALTYCSISLSATCLRSRIMGALRSSSDPRVALAVQKINQNVVFSYPTIKQLSLHIAQLISGDEAGPISAIAAIEQMIEKYSAGLTEVRKSADAPKTPAVLLTGSTGGLGSYMLRKLLLDERVERVYAYNRPAIGEATIQDRQRDAFLDKGFELELLQSPKLVYLQGNSALPRLGLSDVIYEQVRASLFHPGSTTDPDLSSYVHPSPSSSTTLGDSTSTLPSPRSSLTSVARATWST